MSPTVHALRNEIRVTVGRYERMESTGFTKESLAAICEAVGADVSTDSLPPKSEMREAIRERVADIDGDGGGAFRKADLTAIAVELREE
ncbi:hypothetical protein [Haloarchaeobius sp. TZWWS8]|uniref:hypothetical protein n=1 Tax=Haloarchaeobius sp. TZWWS8 TaxID=3446121 RepID=UPI003EBB8553